MKNALRYLFFLLVVRPVVLLVIGMNVRHRERLPSNGPAILVANHNSHLDTAALMSLFPMKLLPRLRPVAALDYFLSSRILAWFSLNIMGIIPLRRKGRDAHEHPLSGCFSALDRNEILILFPEGSRGEPEHMEEFKAGIAHIVERYPHVPVTPVFLHGLGKSLPRGEAILVPFFCDVFVGAPLAWDGTRETFMNSLNRNMQELAHEGNFPPWN